MNANKRKGINGYYCVPQAHKHKNLRLFAFICGRLSFYL